MERPNFLKEIKQRFRTHPIVALLGPRQCGKTTLARDFAGNIATPNYFDLEDPTDLVRLETPKLALESLKNLVIIDEIQRIPDLFPVLRVLVDRANNKARFLILGSASRDLIRQGSESLAGRISYLELTPFQARETNDLRKLWLRGGFPRSFLARSNPASVAWRKAYVATFLERDIPALGFQIPPQSMRKFWMMLAHYHGQILNSSELAQSLAVSDTTVRRYLDILSGTFMIRQLQPWVANLKKRQIKSPKIFFRDSGLFHTLMGIESQDALETHPKIGASWECFAMEEIIRCLNLSGDEVYFWGVHAQAELDLLAFHKGRKIGFEFKRSDTPKLSRSQEASINTLGLHQLYVIYPGKIRFNISKQAIAVGLEEFLREC